METSCPEDFQKFNRNDWVTIHHRDELHGWRKELEVGKSYQVTEQFIGFGNAHFNWTRLKINNFIYWAVPTRCLCPTEKQLLFSFMYEN